MFVDFEFGVGGVVEIDDDWLCIRINRLLDLVDLDDLDFVLSLIISGLIRKDVDGSMVFEVIFWGGDVVMNDVLE